MVLGDVFGPLLVSGEHYFLGMDRNLAIECTAYSALAAMRHNDGDLYHGLMRRLYVKWYDRTLFHSCQVTTCLVKI